jgi:hypothetical protein
MDFVMIPILDGGSPVKQSTAKQSAKATQSGYRIKKTLPLPNEPLWPNDIKGNGKTITYTTPEKGFVNTGREINMSYRVDWSYSYEFATTPSFAGY